MGIRNFNDIEFTPICYKIGDLALRNYWEDKDGIKHTLNSHLYRGYSYFEIVKFNEDGSCFTIASWDDLNDDEFEPDLTLIGSRLFQLDSQTEILLFIELARIGQYRIKSELETFSKNNNY
jgi:hypothetical protein